MSDVPVASDPSDNEPSPIPVQGTLSSSNPVTLIKGKRPRSGSECRQRSGRPVQIRLTEAERAELERRAGVQSLGAYLREAGLGAAGARSRRSPKFDRALLAKNNAELNRVGNNVNQIARQMNRGREPDALFVDEVLVELLAVLALNRKALGYDSQG